MLDPVFAQPAVRSYGYTSIFCFVVGYIAWLAVDKATLSQAMIISFSIGLSINTATLLLRDATEQHLGTYGSAVALTLLGLINGLAVGGTIALNDPWVLFVANKPALVVSVAFGCIGYIVVSTREVLLRTEANLARVRLETEIQEKMLVQSELRLLQAQIEPHFLFNTLTNVVALIQPQPEAAEQMLENLTTLLRSSLHSTRSLETTLADELDVAEAYLSIQSIRMRGRLRYTIEHDPGLDDVRLPPLMLQPLLENAVKYGVEPRQSGGSIHVTTQARGERVEIRVLDPGPGMDADSVDGIGIGNVKERLRASIEGALLSFRPRPEGGLETLIVLPCARQGLEAGQ
jgi:signal transduction histidine kinase